jgi:hypothetical protein
MGDERINTVERLIQVITAEYGSAFEPRTVDDLLMSLRTMGFEENVVRCVAKRWQTVDESLGGGLPTLLLQIRPAVWAVAIIEGIARSWRFPSLSALLEPEDSPGMYRHRIHMTLETPESANQQEGEMKTVPETSTEEKSAEIEASDSQSNQPGHFVQKRPQSSKRSRNKAKQAKQEGDSDPGSSGLDSSSSDDTERSYGSWKRAVTVIDVSAVSDLQTSASLAAYTNKDHVLKSEDAWSALGGDDIGQRFIFHGTTTDTWDNTDARWENGFSLLWCNERNSQLSREQAVYFSNSIAHALYYGAYRAGFCAFDKPFDQINAVVIVVQVDVKRLANFRKKSSFCILEPGNAFDAYVEKNENLSLRLPRITPPYNSDYSCNCTPYKPARSCCRYHYILAPFCEKDQEDLKACSHCREFGGVPVDNIRQLCAATHDAVEFINECSSVAIRYSVQTQGRKKS